MDLLERYLAAVAAELPEAQRADITAELRDVLMTRIEDKESELARPLTARELEALLSDYGHPVAVAGRYRKTQYLIGPEMFPFWWKGLKVTLSWVAGIYVVMIILGVLAGRGADQLLGRAPSLTVALLFSFGVVTLGAAALERYGRTPFLAKWRPHDLPPVGGRLCKARSPFELAVETAMSVVFLLWWIGAISFRSFTPDWLDLSLAPVWQVLFWPIVAYSALEIGANLVAITRPGLAQLNAGLTAAKFLSGGAILAGALRWDRWIELGGGFTSQEQAMSQAQLDHGMRIGLTVTALILIATGLLHAWRVVQLRRGAEPLPA